MTHTRAFERLHQRTLASLARYQRNRVEVGRRRARPPGPGDVFAFSGVVEVAETAALWAICEQDPGDGRVRVVPLDLYPRESSTDIEIPDEMTFGSSVLRLALASWLEPSFFNSAKRVGVLEPRVLDLIRGQQEAISSETLEH